MAAWQDGWWTSPDGLRLHFRDYPGPADRPPILCIPGLTRNARDFGDVAVRLSPRWRVVAVELRGRGESACPRDPMSYIPPVYLGDLDALFDQAGLSRAIFFGTSLGGILTMLAASAWPGRVVGALLNDVGPVIEAQGLERIRAYVGRQQSWPTWLHAARAMREVHGAAFPRFGLPDWIAMAKRLARVNGAGRVVMDYDARIAEPFRAPPPAEPVSLWPALAGLRKVPSLLVRGALSDILSDATASRMQAELPMLERVDVPQVGHTPTLEEPESRAALDRLLARLEPA